MRETGTGQQVAQLHERIMMIIIIIIFCNIWYPSSRLLFIPHKNFLMTKQIITRIRSCPSNPWLMGSNEVRDMK